MVVESRISCGARAKRRTGVRFNTKSSKLFNHVASKKSADNGGPRYERT